MILTRCFAFAARKGITAHIGKEAGAAVGTPRLAHIAAMKNQPVMRTRNIGLGIFSTRVFSVESGVRLRVVRPMRSATRNTWVSTAMAGRS